MPGAKGATHAHAGHGASGQLAANRPGSGQLAATWLIERPTPPGAQAGRRRPPSAQTRPGPRRPGRRARRRGGAAAHRPDREPARHPHHRQVRPARRGPLRRPALPGDCPHRAARSRGRDYAHGTASDDEHRELADALRATRATVRAWTKLPSCRSRVTKPPGAGSAADLSPARRLAGPTPTARTAARPRPTVGASPRPRLPDRAQRRILPRSSSDPGCGDGAPSWGTRRTRRQVAGGARRQPG
jgi:hypothetical protein